MSKTSTASSLPHSCGVCASTVQVTAPIINNIVQVSAPVTIEQININAQVEVKPFRVSGDIHLGTRGDPGIDGEDGNILQQEAIDELRRSTCWQTSHW